MTKEGGLLQRRRQRAVAATQMIVYANLDGVDLEVMIEIAVGVVSKGGL